MKTAFKNLLGLAIAIASIGSVSAQKEPEVGFIRIVNAICPGTGITKLLIDGEDIFPDGYTLGQATGGMGLLIGNHTVEARREGVIPGSTKIDLKNGETTTLIAFAERAKENNEDGTPKWETKLLRLKQSDPEKGYRMALVSVCDDQEVNVTATIVARNATEKATVKRLSITMVDLGAIRSEVFVKSGQELITTVSPDSKGNYVVVLYQDPNRKLCALTFFDPKFMIAG